MIINSFPIWIFNEILSKILLHRIILEMWRLKQSFLIMILRGNCLTLIIFYVILLIIFIICNLISHKIGKLFFDLTIFSFMSIISKVSHYFSHIKCRLSRESLIIEILPELLIIFFFINDLLFLIPFIGGFISGSAFMRLKIIKLGVRIN
jgi:hypothetical protein